MNRTPKSSAEIVIVQAVDRYIIIVSVSLWCPSLNELSARIAWNM